MAIRFMIVSPAEFDAHAPALLEMLCEAINGGAPMGFIAPVRPETTREYWMSIRDELMAGTRLLLAAFDDERVVASGQLYLSAFPAYRHRAGIEKVFVASDMRGRGVGRALLGKLHLLAHARGRSLVYLSTRQGTPAEEFYRRLGYREAGVFPGFGMGPAGQRYNAVAFYRDLAP